MASIKTKIVKGYQQLIWALSKTKKNRVVFSSFYGSSYSDNPRAISEKLHELDDSIEILWLYREKPLENAPSYVKQVNKNNKVEYYSALSTCNVYVENFTFPPIPKKKNQKYIQVWHGDRAFKKILCDAHPNMIGKLQESIPGYCDFAVAGSEYGEGMYRTGFLYKGEILKVGSPRNDILFHVTPELMEQKKKEIGLEKNCHYMLYAPTFRDSNGRHAKQDLQGIQLQATLEALAKQYGGEWKCLLRLHPGVVGINGEDIFNDTIIDVSGYPDMTDIIIVSDVCITDYSSVCGDFALLERPVFLFQDDIEDYTKNDRALYFDMEESPYFAAHDQKELEQLIASTSLEDAAANCRDILAFYKTYETGHAAETVARLIIDHCHKE